MLLCLSIFAEKNSMIIRFIRNHTDPVYCNFNKTNNDVILQNMLDLIDSTEIHVCDSIRLAIDIHNKIDEQLSYCVTM